MTAGFILGRFPFSKGHQTEGERLSSHPIIANPSWVGWESSEMDGPVGPEYDKDRIAALEMAERELQFKWETTIKSKSQVTEIFLIPRVSGYEVMGLAANGEEGVLRDFLNQNVRTEIDKAFKVSIELFGKTKKVPNQSKDPTP